MLQIKICGITNLEDAQVCAEAGADMLGFNFYRRSPRYIAPELARLIIRQLPKNLISVGVFVNEEDASSIVAVANLAGIDAVQLHGGESPAFCAKVKASLTGRFLIKALSVGPNFQPPAVLDYQADAVLLDAHHDQLRGGTGRVFDWLVAARAVELKQKIFLAGGLSADNVGQAIAAVAPYGVDTCSKLEKAPGQKDREQVRAFIAAARSAERNYAL